MTDMTKIPLLQMSIEDDEKGTPNKNRTYTLGCEDRCAFLYTMGAYKLEKNVLLGFEPRAQGITPTCLPFTPKNEKESSDSYLLKNNR